MTTLDIKSKPEVARVIDKCGFELATNFSRPAKEILAFWGFFLGVNGEQMGKLMEKEAA